MVKGYPHADLALSDDELTGLGHVLDDLAREFKDFYQGLYGKKEETGADREPYL